MAGIPSQRWLFHPVDPQAARKLAEAVGVSPLLAQILLNRGLSSPEAARQYWDPNPAQLPDPAADFADLPLAVHLLDQAIDNQKPIAICGDYDADGMTSTALLLRALRKLGGNVHYRIPSRMTEGYGLNSRMVQALHREGCHLILTVDNGISAQEPIQLAKELGLVVIVTDHHDLPPQLPPADAILNPKQIPETSPYRGMAGVGVAYLLAQALAEKRGDPVLGRMALELFTLGTIADLASLTGVNRLWVRQGLQLLPTSQVEGIRALLRATGLLAAADASPEGLRPESIGFGLGPRINAVGRIGQAGMVIKLLTTDDPTQADRLAQRCERLNQVRQQMCARIETEALEQIIQRGRDLQQDRVLTVLGSPERKWHKGVIGIVASRLAERYGCPVFIGSQSRQGEISGSARQGIPEFNVFAALEHCKDLFHKHGGHPAAGGFSLAAQDWLTLEERLRQFAALHLEPEQIQPLVHIDVEAPLADLNLELYQQLQQLQPCGIGNPEPVFCSRNLQLLQQQPFGRSSPEGHGSDKSHLKLLVQDPVPVSGDLSLDLPLRSTSDPVVARQCLSDSGTESLPSNRPLWAIRWRGAELYPLPERVDLAYTLKAKTWRGETQLELEILGIQPAQSPLPSPPLAKVPISLSPPMPKVNPQPTPSASKSLSDLRLIYRPAPHPTQPLYWQAVERFSTLLPQAQGTILFYGFRRPTLSLHSARDPGLVVHYDRPQAGHRYDHLWLWSWPPSLEHLKWLLHCSSSALAQGAEHQNLTISVHRQRIPLVSGEGLRQQLRQYLHNEDKVDLLRLAQQWWLSPRVLVAGLRSLGYPCHDFGPTGSLTEELEAQQAWYGSSWQEVAALLTSERKGSPTKWTVTANA
ncbi:single-stranded-DNA-specific exonuclease RecJ [Synechococcus bigranulatus str. 'Rupite']|uniref:Single-stranded-DNA-specific exonuclease RecJ n=2 Tax=Thermostichus vulcanus TaxID=32053 RepID=A0ABT0C7Q1_THEVL|nr:single-stranded-DNA-specific exonuclease RecJ [Thermostichus vulcanus str. 'Rupite']